jgi:hypothetical protein
VGHHFLEDVLDPRHIGLEELHVLVLALEGQLQGVDELALVL